MLKLTILLSVYSVDFAHSFTSFHMERIDLKTLFKTSIF